MKTLLIAFASLLIFGSEAIAQGTTTKPAPSPEAPASKKFSPNDVVFPEVEGWRAGAKTPLPMGDTGISINYDSPDRERVTVYVYSRQQPAKDLNGVIKDEFEGAIQALKDIAEAGIYSDLKFDKQETTTVAGSVKALKAGLSFTARAARFSSDIIVFPYKEHVIKIRGSRPTTVASNERYLKLLGELEKIFSK
jgi:hypothetical protein